MQRIFKDERRGDGPISRNPSGTGNICPLDVVAKAKTRAALRRFPRLASEQMYPASARKVNVNRPLMTQCVTGHQTSQKPSSFE